MVSKIVGHLVEHALEQPATEYELLHFDLVEVLAVVDSADESAVGVIAQRPSLTQCGFSSIQTSMGDPRVHEWLLGSKTSEDDAVDSVRQEGA